MGAERKTHYIKPEDKKCTAYHEVYRLRENNELVLMNALQGGHALVALYTDGAMPLHKVTCVTRGHALGLVSAVATYPDHKHLKTVILDAILARR